MTDRPPATGGLGSFPSTSSASQSTTPSRGTCLSPTAGSGGSFLTRNVTAHLSVPRLQQLMPAFLVNRVPKLLIKVRNCDVLQRPPTKTSTRLTAQWWPSADAWRYGEVGTEAQVRSSFGYCAAFPFFGFNIAVVYSFASLFACRSFSSLSFFRRGEAHPTVSSDFLPRIGTGKVIIKPNIKRLVPRSDVRTVMVVTTQASAHSSRYSQPSSTCRGAGGRIRRQHLRALR